jgi:hypothetical protein
MSSEGGGVQRIGGVDIVVDWIGSFVFNERPYIVRVFIIVGVHVISERIVRVAIVGGIVYNFIFNSLTHAYDRRFVEIQLRGTAPTRCPPS